MIDGWGYSSLRWRHNDHDSVSNHQPHGCLLNRLFRRRSKKTSKLRVTGLCVGNSPGPVNSPHKGPVTRKKFPFDDVIMFWNCPQMDVVWTYCWYNNTSCNGLVRPGNFKPGAHFTNDFSIVIKIRWKILYVAIYFLAITSLHRIWTPWEISLVKRAPDLRPHISSLDHSGVNKSSSVLSQFKLNTSSPQIDNPSLTGDAHRQDPNLIFTVPDEPSPHVITGNSGDSKVVHDSFKFLMQQRLLFKIV